MNKARDEYDAEQGALEVEMRNARAKATSVIASPSSAPTSELLAMFVGLSVGGALGMPDIVDGTELDRDAALGIVGEEIDRRIPARPV